MIEKSYSPRRPGGPVRVRGPVAPMLPVLCSLPPIASRLAPQASEVITGLPGAVPQRDPALMPSTRAKLTGQTRTSLKQPCVCPRSAGGGCSPAPTWRGPEQRLDASETHRGSAPCSFLISVSASPPSLSRRSQQPGLCN